MMIEELFKKIEELTEKGKEKEVTKTRGRLIQTLKKQIEKETSEFEKEKLEKMLQEQIVLHKKQLNDRYQHEFSKAKARFYRIQMLPNALGLQIQKIATCIDELRFNKDMKDNIGKLMEMLKQTGKLPLIPPIYLGKLAIDNGLLLLALLFAVEGIHTLPKQQSHSSSSSDTPITGPEIATVELEEKPVEVSTPVTEDSTTQIEKTLEPIKAPDFVIESPVKKSFDKALKLYKETHPLQRETYGPQILTEEEQGTKKAATTKASLKDSLTEQEIEYFQKIATLLQESRQIILLDNAESGIRYFASEEEFITAAMKENPSITTREQARSLMEQFQITNFVYVENSATNGIQSVQVYQSFDDFLEKNAAIIEETIHSSNFERDFNSLVPDMQQMIISAAEILGVSAVVIAAGVMINPMVATCIAQLLLQVQPAIVR